MKTTLAFISLLLLSTYSFAQKFTYNQGGTTSKNYYEEIPYENVGGKLYVFVEIGGKKHKFLFDTGAPTQITAQFFKDLNPDIIKRDIVVDATGNRDSLNIASIKEIKINSIAFNDIPALVINSNIYTCMHIDGVVGSNLMRNSIVSIIPEKQRIIFTDDIKKVPANKKTASTLYTDYAQSYPYIELQMAGKLTFRVGFDTGESDFLVPAETDMTNISKYKVFEKITSGYGAGTRSIFGLQKNDSTSRLKFPLVKVGGCTFTNAINETNKSNLTRMGTKLLKYGLVTLDFMHHKFYYEAKTDTVNLGEKQWPLRPTVTDDNKLLIGIVWQSLIDKVKPGDQIIAIDDTSTQTVDLCERINATKGMFDDRQAVTLTVKNDKGEVKKVVINKE